MINRRTLLASAVIFLALSGMAFAQVSGGGNLTVNATVQGSISLVFKSDASGITLTGDGTAAATLPIGTVQMYGGTVPGNVTRTLTSNTAFTVATPFDVEVDKANSSSTGFTLSAQLNSADAVNTWAIGATTITNSATQLTTTGTYTTPAAYTLNLTIPATNTSGSVSNQIVFTATAN